MNFHQDPHTHLNDRPFSCKCGKRYKRKQHLRRHLTGCSIIHYQSNREQSVYDKNSKTYTCPQCSSGPFRKKKHVWAHVAIVHSERKHVCDKCDRSFPTLSKLQRHSSRHHGYACTLCHPMQNDGASNVTRFNNFITLRRHIAQAHPKPCLQCPTCGMRFNRPSALSEHEATHTPGGLSLRRLFICPLCQDFQSSLSNVPDVTTGHSSSSPSSTLVAFTVKRNLDAHIRSVHANRSFPCTWSGCPVLLSTKQKLLQHLERHELGKAVARRTRGRRNVPKTITPEFDSQSSRKFGLDQENHLWETASQNSILALLEEPYDQATVQ